MSLDRQDGQIALASKQPLRALSKEETGRHVEQFGELLRLRLADRSLSAHNLRGYAAGTKHIQQIALAQAVLFQSGRATGCWTLILRGHSWRPRRLR
jgi:hypothetical protein